MKNVSLRDFSVVVPTLNEKGCIVELLDKINALDKERPEIIVSDGGSRDGTCEAVEEYAKSHSNVKLLHNPDTPELSPSVVHGFDVAAGKYIACIDGDMQHDESCLLNMAGAFSEGAEMVVGSRHSLGGRLERGWPLWRRFASWLGSVMVCFASNVKVSDPMSGCFALEKDCFLAVRKSLRPKGFKIMLELATRLTRAKPEVRIKEVGIVFHNRHKGKSKFGLRMIIKFLLMLVEIRFG